MTLEKREEELYRRDGLQIEKPTSGIARKIPVEKQEPGKEWGTVEAFSGVPEFPKKGVFQKYYNYSRKIFRSILWTAIIISFILGGGYLFFRWWSKPSVTLTIQGPTEVRAGELASYEILIQNSAKSSLEKTSLTIRAGSGVLFPDTSERIKREELQETFLPSTSRKEKFAVYFLGKEGNEREVEVTFRYRISNIASEFAKTEKIKVKIAAPALLVNFNLPKQALSAVNFPFGLEVKNISELSLKYLYAEIIYPEDFTFLSSTPVLEEGKRWELPELPKNSNLNLSVSGRINADVGQVRSFGVKFFTKIRNEDILLSEVFSEISIIENPLVIAMSVNGSTNYIASVGEFLEYRITFKNNFSETLRDIVVIVKLNGKMFDLKTLDSDGAFDSRTRTITFHGGNSPQLLFLNAQESGSVGFRIKVLDEIPAGEKNNIISASAEMTSATQPKYLGIEGPVRAATSIDTKINGIINLSSRVFLRDVSRGFTVNGPWPLRANQTTEMTVRWQVSALGNDFSDIIVSSILPAGVSYLGDARGNIAGTQVTANPRTATIEWKISTLGANQSKELIFQIGITPSVADIGNPKIILNPVSLSATDNFTGKRMEISTKEIRSDDLGDPSTKPEEGIVRE